MITIMIAAVFCTLTVFFSVRYVRHAFDTLDEMLGQVWDRKSLPPSVTTVDSRLSKVLHRAQKLIQRNQADIHAGQAEKENIQQFLSDMSHQMKTPLAAVTMYTDLLLDSPLQPDERQEFLTRIKNNAGQMQWMMDGLLKMSRLEVGAIAIEAAPNSLKTTLSASLDTVYAEATSKSIRLEVLPFDDRLLLHDRKWTSEALVNLLENAIKYAPVHDTIYLAVESLPLYTRISITDHGIGVASEEWNHIFKRFYRGKNARNNPGAGLGLYLAARIAETQGGYVMVDSKPGTFTTFSLFLQNCQN